MVVMQFKTKYTGFVPTDMTKSVFNRMKKRTWRDLGVMWHREYRPKHFTPEGAREYGYLPRRGERLPKGSKGFFNSYTGRKFHKHGHMDPLVWSGDSRTASRIMKIIATSKGVKIPINAPKLNYRPKGGRINMRLEMITISRPEQRALREKFDKTLEAKMNRYRGAMTRMTR